MDVGDHFVGVHSQLSLRRGQLAAAGKEHGEHTLKI